MMHCCEIPVRKKSQKEFNVGPLIIRHLATENANNDHKEREGDKSLFWAKSFPFSDLSSET